MRRCQALGRVLEIARLLTARASTRGAWVLRLGLALERPRREVVELLLLGLCTQLLVRVRLLLVVVDDLAHDTFACRLAALIELCR